MDENRKKYIARQFLQSLSSASEKIENFEHALVQFINNNSETRYEIALGLMAIADDKTEKNFQRGFALCVLATMVRVLDVANDVVLEEHLNRLVDCAISEYSSDNDPIDDGHIRYRAILALLAVNRDAGLNKIDQLYPLFDDSEFGRELSHLREQFSRQ